VLGDALETAALIAGNGPLAVRGTKRSLCLSEGHDLDQQLDTEAAEQALCYESQDLVEGLAASRARRDPDFKGS
jgi:enoyl-CoA hydratase/carnithine racemase